jgi:YD repeat-containing protein
MAGNRGARTVNGNLGNGHSYTTYYDSQGRVYRSETYNVNPVTGQTGDALVTNNWYDPDGNLLATQTGTDGAFEKYVYDGLGDQVESALCYGDDNPTSINSDDKVIQETHTFYDAASEPVATVTFEALPGASWSGPLLVSGQFSPGACYESGSATFYDGIGRDVEDVDYGHERPGDTSHYLFDGNSSIIQNTDKVPSVAESAPPAPDSSTNYLVSQTVYNAPTSTGQAIDTIDNAGTVSRTIYDPAGRVTRTIQDYTGSGEFSGGIPAETDTDKDATTDYVYDSAGRLAAQIAYDPNGTSVIHEQTTYLYGSLVDGSLVTAVVDPDSTDTLAYNATTRDWSISAGTDHTSTAYDSLGRTTATTDQRGVTHTYTYDSAGRPAADTVTNFGDLPAAAQTVNQIATSYDDVGRVQTVTSNGLVGSIVPVSVQNLCTAARPGSRNVKKG